ncbi:hypothetical protein [Pseudomonas salmasensis]|uniref:hypothetical protein n=1 Tax=Pseudomonas salmasensis TaxID=2745514 RepID=UPI00164424E3|nr:hypothetical protein [Pseudomonas salmasensis]QXH79700.1 hypothetical protein HU731_007840 [Pseudomonas salmasensis]
MNRDIIFIPDFNSPQTPNNHFEWTFKGSQTPITAERTAFGHVEHENFWLFSGSIGSLQEKNSSSFVFYIPYLGEAPIDDTYTLDGILKYAHYISGPGDIPGVAVIPAKKATLTIKLNPVERTANGNFEASFDSEYAQYDATGHFTLTRDR